MQIGRDTTTSYEQRKQVLFNSKYDRIPLLVWSAVFLLSRSKEWWTGRPGIIDMVLPDDTLTLSNLETCHGYFWWPKCRTVNSVLLYCVVLRYSLPVTAITRPSTRWCPVFVFQTFYDNLVFPIKQTHVHIFPMKTSGTPPKTGILLTVAKNSCRSCRVIMCVRTDSLLVALQTWFLLWWEIARTGRQYSNFV